MKLKNNGAKEGYQVKLKQLGIDEDDLKAAVLAGELARNNASLLHPKMFPGYYAFAERVRMLRERLLAKGWKAVYESGLELACNPDDSIAILVSAGDPFTGVDDKNPKSKNRKGRSTKKLIAVNQGLLCAEDDLGFMTKPPILDSSRRASWYLLVYPSDKEIRYELALPNKLDPQRVLCGWAERIILDPIKFDEVVTPKNSDKKSESEEVADVEITVSRKA